MEKNEHSHMVVMSKEVYDHLRYLAGIGSREVSNHLEDCDRHIRKFNIHIKEKADYERRGEILRRREDRHAVYDLMKRKGGQTVYYIDGVDRYISGELRRFVWDKDGWPLLVLRLDCAKEDCTVHPSKIVEDLPTGANVGFRDMFGRWFLRMIKGSD